MGVLAFAIARNIFTLQIKAIDFFVRKLSFFFLFLCLRRARFLLEKFVVKRIAFHFSKYG